MTYFHDEKDTEKQLREDVRDSDNPQHSNPDSIRESARQELERRGYSKQEIDDIRLGR
jgi:hypothetical protein